MANSSFISLEAELASIDMTAKQEEQATAKEIKDNLREELFSIRIPYPNTKTDETAIDKEDLLKIQYEKSQNMPYWLKQAALIEKVNALSLYSGHLLYDNHHSYLFMDSQLYKTQDVGMHKLVNVDDRTWAQQFKDWLYPDKESSVQYSRHITMNHFKVTDVNVTLDRTTSAYANISDAFLRQTLLRNKDNPEIQSIIQTIQEKQNIIRSLPVNTSFLVQGCAGSGKTMVLLHRLRYLIYNKDLYSDDYIYLVPSFQFKNYIRNISAQFNISAQNIIPFQAYYQQLLGVSSQSGSDTNELVFPAEYLARVYSTDFIRECYQLLFDSIQEKVEELINRCEHKLQSIIDTETNKLTSAKETAIHHKITAATELCKKITPYISVQFQNTHDIEKLIEQLEEQLQNTKEKHAAIVIDSNSIVIDSSDERVVGHPMLQQIRKNIIAEEIILQNATFFTRASHEKKKSDLEQLYTSKVTGVIAEIVQLEKQKLAEQALRNTFVFDGVTIQMVEEIISALRWAIEQINDEIASFDYRREHFYEALGKKISNEISSLNRLIEISGELDTKKIESAETPQPEPEFFNSLFTCAINTYTLYSELFSEEEKKNAKFSFPIFNKKSTAQIEAYCNTQLFNICKHTLKQEFSLGPHSVYKHYWYLRLYCRYLTKKDNWNPKQYIFIDEGQDLSPAEYDLIYRLNSTTTEKPVLNVFGDVHQMITSHGVTSWDVISNSSTIYYLDENFRNSNQIVAYCNEIFPFAMKQIGVDMQAVSEYATAAECPSLCSRNKSVIIVKDEYVRMDVRTELDIPIDTTAKNTQPEIYTIKEVKGLEFPEVFVFDRDMSQNERYIAFTRPLKKLNVIKSLPYHTDHYDSLIEQGEDDEDIDNPNESENA